MKSPLEERKRIDPSDILSIEITLPSFFEIKFCTSGKEEISSLNWLMSLILEGVFFVNLARSPSKLATEVELELTELENTYLLNYCKID